MKVTVDLQAYLDKYAPNEQNPFEHTLEDGATVLTLVHSLSIPEEMASIVVINDRNGDWDDPLADGDRVTLIPPLAGG